MLTLCAPSGESKTEIHYSDEANGVALTAAAHGSPFHAVAPAATAKSTDGHQ
jgi:hypothetical protein